VNNNDINNDEIEKINLIDFGRLKKINPAIIEADIGKYINTVVNRLVQKDSLTQFYKYFNGISNIDKKIKIYFQKLVANEFEPNMSLIHWLEQSNYCNYTIISMLDISRMGKEFWKFTKLNIYHIPIINRNKLFTLKKSIFGILNFVLNYNKIKSKANHKQREDKRLNLKMFKVMFFPHKSIFYGDLFLKDHFYSKDSSSGFYPEKIIHLEYDDIDIEEARVKYKNYFEIDPSYHSIHNFVSMDNYESYKKFIENIDKQLIIAFITKKVSLSIILNILNLYFGFLYFESAIKKFSNVKIALVGYDNLFPLGLSLALEARGIKTIAIQERFITPCLNTFSYIMDTQLTASNYITSILKNKSEMYYVNNYLPTGLIRSDKLCNSKPNSNTKRILVFDYHVENNFNYQISQPVINWANDLFFRKEIIKIAKDFKDYDFIVRGKNIEWTRMPYFKNILEQWNNTPNITIDADYSEFYRSYNLCNKSDLIIARQTSIADECISKGKDVIIHDYGINYDHFMSSVYPKIPGINFCHSYKELKAHMSFFHKNGYITNQREKDKIIETLFDGLSDGNVQSRITQYLNKIDYKELK